MEALGFDPEQIQQRTRGYNPRGFPIFNARMRRARWDKGLTQKGLAGIVGVSNVSISHIEMLMAFPIPELAQSIAEALNQEVETLFPAWLQYYLREMRAMYVVRRLKPDKIVELENNGTLSPAVVDPEKVFSKAQLRQAVGWAFAMVQIKPDDWFVMAHRFGLDGEEEETLTVIGRCLGVNRETARRREAVVLRHLRHHMIALRLRDFLG